MSRGLVWPYGEASGCSLTESESIGSSSQERRKRKGKEMACCGMVPSPGLNGKVGAFKR